MDARFIYANERTFLVWNRTALALIATGVAATQLLPNFGVVWGRRLLGLPLIALGGCRSSGEPHRHRKGGRPLGELKRPGRPKVFAVMTGGTLILAIAALALALVAPD